MNTTSLVLNGKTLARIRSQPNSHRGDLVAACMHQHHLLRTSNTQHPLQSPTSSSPPLSIISLATIITSPPPPPPTSPASSSSRRPSHPHRSASSKSSPGWYSKEGELSLEDFAEQLKTRRKRFEVYMGRCGQSVVMAILFSPTPLVLFLLNPISLMVWMVVGVWMLWG